MDATLGLSELSLLGLFVEDIKFTYFFILGKIRAYSILGGLYFS